MTSDITSVQLFQIPKDKVGEKGAEALIDFVNVKTKETNEVNLKTLATKEDVARIEGELKTKLKQQKVKP